jgi:hypothetical protein
VPKNEADCVSSFHAVSPADDVSPEAVVHLYPMLYVHFEVDFKKH